MNKGRHWGKGLEINVELDKISEIRVEDVAWLCSLSEFEIVAVIMGRKEWKGHGEGWTISDYNKSSRSDRESGTYIMVSGGHSFHSNQAGESNSNLNPLQEGGNSSGTANEAVALVQPPRALPVSKVHRIMRRVLPTNAKISKESREFVVECASDFISHVTGEANHLCQLEHRRIITAEDVIDAMRRLGFDEYADVLIRFLQRYRHNASDALVGQQVPLHPTIPFPPYDGVLVGPPPPPPAAFYAPNPLPDPLEIDGDEASDSGNSSSGSFDPMR